jgi:hypothetical protein
MAKKYNIDADNPQELPTVSDDILEEIEAAGGEKLCNLKCRVYRYVRTAENGKVKQEYCGVFERIIKEEDIANNFGGGDYSVKYYWRDKEGNRQETSRVYTISNEIFKRIDKTEEGAAGAAVGTPNAPAVIAPQANAAGGLLGNLLGNLTAEKVTAGLALLDAVKKFLAPPPAPDYTPLFKMMLETNRGQTVGDAVVIEALKQANKPAAPAPTVMEQINNLKAVRDAFAGDFAGGEQSTRGSDKMDTLIEMGLKYLPDLLAKHNNNYNAAGAEASKNIFVQNLIKSDPDLTNNFFAVAAEKYGRDAAMQLANGFGVQIDFNEGDAAQQPPQIAQQQPAQPDAAAAQ